METRKQWFPALVAAFWVALAAYTISDFAQFSGTTRPLAEAAAAERALSSGAGGAPVPAARTGRSRTRKPRPAPDAGSGPLASAEEY